MRAAVIWSCWPWSTPVLKSLHGHIHVYAPLRGKAMAGARGNTDARIFALELNAELLSIAGVYRTSEHPLPAHVQGKPTQVRLVATTEGDKLVFDAMN